jgi:hypothetical protein
MNLFFSVSDFELSENIKKIINQETHQIFFLRNHKTFMNAEHNQ